METRHNFRDLATVQRRHLARFFARLGLVLAVLTLLPGRACPAPPVDLLLVNGKIWTGHPQQPEAEAIAIQDDRIVAVGKSADVRAQVGPTAKVIDLAGRRVVPGFIDSHIHLLGGGQRLSQVVLKDAKDEAELGKRLRDFDRKLPRDRWLLGGDWDHDRTLAGKLPDAALLDKYVPDRLCILRRYDGHMALVNARTLKAAGITADTPDPAGGVIYRLPNSKEPSGLLRDNAMGLVMKLVPPPGDDEIAESVRAALAEIRQLGLTSVVDMDGSGAKVRAALFRHYQQLARDGKLTARVDLRWPLAEYGQLADLGVRYPYGDDWVTIGGLKGFVDGSLGSSTARMFEPYLNEKDSTGIYVTPLEKLERDIRAADSKGLNVAVHAIGDRANAELLDIFAAVARENGARDRRFRIEHAQHLRPQDIKRFAELGVIASLQPYHIIDDGRWAEARIGSKLCETSYANRALLDAGAKLAFGSDWSVAPLDPLAGIDAAVHRRTLDGKHPAGWFPAQRIKVSEALDAYTLSAAYALFQEKRRGSLAAGKLADLVVLSRDILDPKEQDRIASTQVVLTMVGGKIVFERP